MVMRIFFVPRTTGDIVSFASTALDKAMNKRNLKIGESTESRQNLQTQRKTRGDEPWIRRQFDCVHFEDMKINGVR